MRARQILLPRWLVPVQPEGMVLENHAVVVANGQIEAIVPAAGLGENTDGERIYLPSHALIPGLVNCHTHSAMSLMRGMADDLPLMRWLEEHIWPAERRWV